MGLPLEIGIAIHNKSEGEKKRARILRRVMLFWTLFIGIGAVAGSVGMLAAPDGSAMGMQAILPYFQALPLAKLLYQDFIFPGIALLIVNGLTNLLAAYLIFRRRKAGAYLGCSFGVTLMLWITIQFVIFPPNFMSTLYFAFGTLQFLCGAAYIVFYKQDEFIFDEGNYRNIGSNPDILVAYFSRLGYTRRIAYQKANELGAELYEITTPERTAGFIGFAWLGRFGMHKWAMPVNDVAADISKYKKVVIVTPVHVFTAAPPVKGLCEACRGKLKAVEYVSVHYSKCGFSGVFREMDKALQIKAYGCESIVCRYGRVVSAKKICQQRNDKRPELKK